ncbi:unnamed protein product, partial [marine sediment metagenome]
RDLEAKLVKIQKEFAEATGGKNILVAAASDLAGAQQAVANIENPVGKTLLSLFMPTLNRLLEASFRLRTEREATRAFLAVRLYQMRTGRLPDSLDELVKENILPSVPVDMFADKPLRYDPKRRLIWSVGPDEVDDGGEGKPGDPRGKDYVLAIPEWP